MSRPWEKFVYDLQIVVGVDFVGRKDAVFAVDRKQSDRDHQVTGKLEGVGLGERKIVRHLKWLHRERANSRSMAPHKARGRARSPRGEAGAAEAC